MQAKIWNDIRKVRCRTSQTNSQNNEAAQHRLRTMLSHQNQRLQWEWSQQREKGEEEADREEKELKQTSTICASEQATESVEQRKTNEKRRVLFESKLIFETCLPILGLSFHDHDEGGEERQRLKNSNNNGADCNRIHVCFHKILSRRLAGGGIALKSIRGSIWARRI